MTRVQLLLCRLANKPSPSPQPLDKPAAKTPSTPIIQVRLGFYWNRVVTSRTTDIHLLVSCATALSSARGFDVCAFACTKKKKILFDVTLFEYYYQVSLIHSLCTLPPLACSRLLAATFAVNAALVASQWQRRASTVSLHQSLNADHKPGHFAVWPDRESNPARQFRWHVPNQLDHSAG